MSIPYSEATGGDRARGEIEKVLRAFGCTKFASGQDFATGEAFVQFEHRGRLVHLTASARGYAAAWLKENPYGFRCKGSRAEWEAKAMQKGNAAVFSILRDWIKGQVTAITVGAMTFEAAFLAHLSLPDGTRLLDAVTQRGFLPALGEGAPA